MTQCVSALVNRVWLLRRWKRNGTWQVIHDALRRQVRLKAGRKPEPFAAIGDSQSVKTMEKG
jgi:transposase